MALFSDYFDFCLLLPNEVFAASSIINGDAKVVTSFVEFFYFGDLRLFSSTGGRFDYIAAFFFESDNFRPCR